MLPTIGSMKPTAPLPVAIAVMSIELPARIDSTAALKLLPCGPFRAIDGRPNDVAAWMMNAAIAQALITRAQQSPVRTVIDYEHQTLLAEKNGQPAPAAGWFKQLEWREGDGLYAVDVEWTARASSMITASEYRYLSPVFTYDKQTGAVQTLLHVALTNHPALDSLGEVRLAALSRMPQQAQQETTILELSELLALLGLPAGSDPETVKTAIAALKQAATTTAPAVALNTSPDPAQFVPLSVMHDMQTQMAALSAKIVERDVDQIVTAALADARLLPAQEKWARDLGRTNLAALQSYLNTAQPIAALNAQQTQSASVSHSATTITDPDDLAVCTAMGITPEQFLQAKGQ